MKPAVTTTQPRVIAHAGGSAHAPANTLGAYRHAHQRWSNIWMEFDAQFSSDGQLMVIHDPTLDRTTAATGNVSDHTAAELSAINAAATFEYWGFEPIPTVEELFVEGADQGWQLVMEVKNIPGQPRFDETGTTYADAIVDLLSRSSFPLDRLVVIAFWAPTLDRIKERLPHVPVGFLSTDRLPGDLGVSAEENLERCLRSGYDISAPNHLTADLSREHVTSAHSKGVQVHSWTMNERHDIDRAINLGLLGLTSDHPDQVLEALDA